MSQANLSDNDLISACLDGKKSAWDLFVERFSKLIYWAIQKCLKDAPVENKNELCQEVFQEIFQKLLQKDELGKLRDYSHVRKFLVVMSTHLTLDRLKAIYALDRKNVSIEAAVSESEANSNLSFQDVIPGKSLDPSEEAASKEMVR